MGISHFLLCHIRIARGDIYSQAAVNDGDIGDIGKTGRAFHSDIWGLISTDVEVDRAIDDYA